MRSLALIEKKKVKQVAAAAKKAAASPAKAVPKRSARMSTGYYPRTKRVGMSATPSSAKKKK